LHGECIIKDAVKRAYEENKLKYREPEEKSVNGTIKKKTPKKEGKRKSSGAEVDSAAGADKELFTAELFQKETDVEGEKKYKLMVNDLREGHKSSKEEDVRCLLCSEMID